MTKINKTDLENISLIKKELKLRTITTIKIKKNNYEIELSSAITNQNLSAHNISQSEEKTLIDTQVKKTNEKPENIVKSPMVGVAYLSADPSTPPYVKVGQNIKQDETLLLIEAMKTFNEVKAPKSGVIKKIIVLNSQPVEFGDDLIIIE